MQKNSIAAIVICILLLHLISPTFADFGTIKTSFENGEQAFRNKNFEMAASYFAKAVKLAPQDLKSRFRYGQSLFSLNRFDESYSQFRIVLENSPNNIIARVYLAENLIKLGRTEEAAAHLNWILKVQPGHARASELLNEIQSHSKEIIPNGFQPLPVKDVAPSADNPKILPYESTNQAKTEKKATVITKKEKKALPPNPIAAKSWDVSSFISKNSDSFLVNLEYGRYAIEKGDLITALERLNIAERLAKKQQNIRRFLEVQILTSLVYIYSKDFLAFGKHLMKLRNLLSENSYQSFLDIYNQAKQLKTDSEITRLSAGVAMGAGHYAVAAELLKKALEQSSGDILLLNMLAEAQMQNLDYSGAEITLNEITRQDQKNAEAYFNLGRFYLTALYRPDMARKYIEYGHSLKPNEVRFFVLLALLDYSEGKIETAITRLQQLLPKLEDPTLKTVCQQIINDRKYGNSTNDDAQINFAEIMALPGASHAPKSAFRIIANKYLKRGSFFSAMRYFLMAQDLAEVGRTYLGLSSALYLSNEEHPASIAAGYGLKALNEELVRNPQSARANLYLALYYIEHDELLQARQAIKRGLNSNADRNTRQHLIALLKTIDQPKQMMNPN